MDDKLQKKNIQGAEASLAKAEERLAHLLKAEKESKKPRKILPEGMPDWDKTIHDAETEVSKAKDFLAFAKETPKTKDPVQETKDTLAKLDAYVRLHGKDKATERNRVSLERRLAKLTDTEYMDPKPAPLSSTEQRLLDLERRISELEKR